MFTDRSDVIMIQDAMDFYTRQYLFAKFYRELSHLGQFTIKFRDPERHRYQDQMMVCYINARAFRVTYPCSTRNRTKFNQLTKCMNG